MCRSGAGSILIPDGVVERHPTENARREHEDHGRSSGVVCSTISGAMEALLGVQLEERLRERPCVVPAEDGVWERRAWRDMAARVAVPEVRREPGERWIR